MTGTIQKHLIVNHILDNPDTQWWQSAWFLNFQKSCVGKSFWVSEIEKYNCEYVLDKFGRHYLVFNSMEDWFEFRMVFG
jgi:hypothetical protein